MAYYSNIKARNRLISVNNLKVRESTGYWGTPLSAEADDNEQLRITIITGRQDDY